ncbi:hypothetical protein HDU98_011742 [Podochytrium sp. JEL0797]|nr:hypothetical protein HDU98_011742 [Podochytrium sp. JEL0797]
MESFSAALASFDDRLHKHDPFTAPAHSTAINMAEYPANLFTGLYKPNPPPPPYQQVHHNSYVDKSVQYAPTLPPPVVPASAAAVANIKLGSLVARFVVRVPWKPILQRVPGLWLIAILGLAVFGPVGIKYAYAETIKQATTDWLGEYLRVTGAASGEDTSHDMPYDHILHLLIIPNYSEDVDTLCETLDVLSSHRRALTQYRICLAMEETEQGSIEKARMLMKMYSDCFFDITYTIHPANQPGEIRGKSSNVAFAAREMARYSARSGAASAASAAECTIDGIYSANQTTCEVPFNATRHDHEIVTILDADTIFAEDYFAAMACHYATASPSQRKIMMFMPSTVFDRNSDKVPILVRTCDTYWSLGVMSNMYDASPVKLPCSAYSISMDLCIAVNFWDAGPESIGEDLHMYLKCFFSTSGNVIIKPIYSAVSCCNIEGAASNTSSKVVKFYNGLCARYDQAKRHLWGSLDTAYIIKRTIYALFAPGYDAVIPMKNLGKEDPHAETTNQKGFDLSRLRCLFHRVLETHCLMGHFAILGLVRSVMAQLPLAVETVVGPQMLPVAVRWGFPAFLTFDRFAATIMFCCVLCNFTSASYYEKYYKFSGFERWALQTLPAKPPTTHHQQPHPTSTKPDKFSIDNAATVANNRLVGLATMAKHALQFAPQHATLRVQPLGRRPQLSSPRYALNCIEWCLIPYAALFYFVIPQCHAQLSHLVSDKLDYRVSAKPQLRTSSLAALTMEEVVMSAKGMGNEWSEENVPYAEVVSLKGGSESDSKSVTVDSDIRGDDGYYEEDF